MTKLCSSVHPGSTHVLHLTQASGAHTLWHLGYPARGGFTPSVSPLCSLLFWYFILSHYSPIYACCGLADVTFSKCWPFMLVFWISNLCPFLRWIVEFLSHTSNLISQRLSSHHTASSFVCSFLPSFLLSLTPSFFPTYTGCRFSSWFVLLPFWWVVSSSIPSPLTLYCNNIK